MPSCRLVGGRRALALKKKNRNISRVFYMWKMWPKLFAHVFAASYRSLIVLSTFTARARRSGGLATHVSYIPLSQSNSTGNFTIGRNLCSVRTCQKHVWRLWRSSGLPAIEVHSFFTILFAVKKRTFHFPNVSLVTFPLIR